MSEHGFFDLRRLQRGRLNDLDPVSVRILDKGQRFHAAVSQAFLEVHAQGFKALAGSDDIRYRDADMAETAGVGIAVVVSEIGIVLGAVVVSSSTPSTSTVKRPTAALPPPPAAK